MLVDTDRFLEMNRQRSLDDGFMHAVFNPSFNALATAMATARHRASKVLEIARDRHVEQALNETPEKLNRDRRPVLLSDPGDDGPSAFPCLEFPGEIFFMGELLRRDKAQSTGIA